MSFSVLKFIRPPDIVCRRTYILARILSFFCLSFFTALSPSSLNGTQPKSATCSEVTAIWKCISKIWGIPPPTNRGPNNDLFGRLRDLTATLAAYIFQTKRDIDNRWSALTTTRGLLYVVPKCHELWSTNGCKLDRSFYPLYVNSALYVIDSCLNNP